jgi:acylphosphatase
VGFRYLARGLAQRFGLVGFVQNLPDGRVLLVADGTVPAIDRLLQAIADEMSRFIRNTQVTVLSAGNEFSEFDIRH